MVFTNIWGCYFDNYCRNTNVKSRSKKKENELQKEGNMKMKEF